VAALGLSSSSAISPAHGTRMFVKERSQVKENMQ